MNCLNRYYDEIFDTLQITKGEKEGEEFDYTDIREEMNQQSFERKEMCIKSVEKRWEGHYEEVPEDQKLPSNC